MGNKEKWPKVYVTGVPEGEKRKKKKKWKLGVAFIFLMLLSKYSGFYYFFKNADHYLTSYMKINSRWINEFNVRNKITKPSRIKRNRQIFILPFSSQTQNLKPLNKNCYVCLYMNFCLWKIHHNQSSKAKGQMRK